MRTTRFVMAGARVAPLLAALLALALPALAAEPASRVIRGVVVRIDAPEFVVDLGTASGLAAGTRLVLYRTIRARHPVTGKEVLDRFPIGEASADEVAERLAILRPDAALARLLQVGDRVEFALAAPPQPEVSARPSGASGAKAASTAAGDSGAPCIASTTCPPCPLSGGGERRPADVVDAEQTFHESLGREAGERVRLWQQFLERNGATSLRKAVEAEIDSLSVQMAEAALARDSVKVQTHARKLARAMHHPALPVLRVGEPAWLVFSAGDWSQVTDLRVHYRAVGQGSFAMARPEATGRLARRLRLPDALVAEPGFEYFVEATHETQTARLAGTPQMPQRVAVLDQLGSKPERGSGTTLRILAEHADFNRYRGDDAMLVASMELTYRLGQSRRLAAFTMGYGLLSGVGGEVAEVDDPTYMHTSGAQKGKTVQKDDTIFAQRASFKHAFLGAEWVLLPSFNAITRVVVGLDESGLDTGLEVAGRVGPEDGTNLQVGMSTLGDMGRAAFVALGAHVIERVPMTGLFEVTNRPVGKDLGIRLVYEATWLATSHIGLTGRVGYDLRTINHAGPSLGGGVAFHW